MQLFRCPFCGLRDETEFVFGAEAGNTRPEPAAQTSDSDWSRYLYMNSNPKGSSREIWVHVTCGEFFVMERDTVTHVVSASHAIGGDGE
jgi:sarcosine oxidase, subunit delta